MLKQRVTDLLQQHRHHLYYQPSFPPSPPPLPSHPLLTTPRDWLIAERKKKILHKTRSLITDLLGAFEAHKHLTGRSRWQVRQHSGELTHAPSVRLYRRRIKAAACQGKKMWGKQIINHIASKVMRQWKRSWQYRAGDAKTPTPRETVLLRGKLMAGGDWPIYSYVPDSD